MSTVSDPKYFLGSGESRKLFGVAYLIPMGGKISSERGACPQPHRLTPGKMERAGGFPVDLWTAFSNCWPWVGTGKLRQEGG